MAEYDWGGDESDGCKEILQTTDGGFILGGYSVSGNSIDKSDENYGPTNTQDYWIVKINAIGNIQWENTYGGNDFDMFSDLDQTFDGGYILGGTSQSDISGIKTENSDNQDFWIIKISALGNIEWQNTIGHTTSEELSSISQTSDGGYIAGGTKLGFNPYYNFYIVKLDNSGNVEWEKTYGGSDYDALNSIEETAEGGFIIGTSSRSGISGYKTEASMGGLDYWVIKIDPLGNIEWQNTIGGSGDDDLNLVKQVDDGGFILGGNSVSNISGDKTENSIGAADYWIIKLDDLGNIVWQNTIGGVEEEQLNCINQTSDAGYVVSGYSKSGISGDKSQANKGPAGSTDFWLIQMDEFGNLLWELTLGGSGWDVCYAGLETFDGGFAFSGISGSPVSGDKTETNFGVEDFWVVKLYPFNTCNAPGSIYTDNINSTSAAVHWNSVTGATKYQINYRPAGGGTWQKKNSSMTFKNLTGLIPNTTYEYKIKTICAGAVSPFSSLFNFTTLPLKDGELTKINFIIYPNPSSEKIIISLSSTQLTTHNSPLAITDLSGKTISEINITSPETEIDISGFPDGIYFVRINFEKNTTTEKFIKN
ncbi:MAG: T9SS type A sorting domain-containing protein [Chitinophagales bacterium]